MAWREIVDGAGQKDLRAESDWTRLWRWHPTRSSDAAGNSWRINQRQQGLEVRSAGAHCVRRKPTAVSSFNFHQDHFGSTFGIQLHDGTVANSACLGFGLERITLALFRAHGMDAPRLAQETFAIGFGLRPPHRGEVTRMLSLLGLDPGKLRAERAAPARTGRFGETNCYVDFWIELVHALGLDPIDVVRVRGRLRRRSVDLLQAAARGTGSTLRNRRA